MRTKSLQHLLCLAIALWLLAGCAQSAPAADTLTPTEIATTAPIEASAPVENTVTDLYEPVSAEVCQMLQESAAEALAVEVSLENPAPFEDFITGEGGQGCRLTASGDGNRFASPQAALETLVNSVGLGWNEQVTYQADGPTGSATALSRDMALMLVSANWEPAEGADCPQDQPISDCDLTPDQQVYTIQIDVAQYTAGFSLDGHWEDAATGFSLDLYQEWKTIYGHHTVVAQGGDKIDSLDVSIDGSLQGQVATVQFQSSYTNDTGLAEITYVDVHTITWKIIDPPDGEYYLPAEATLTRN
jgi:hypothetical protein